MSTPKMKRHADGSRHRDRRRAEAELHRPKLTAELQLAELDRRLGNGVDATKERVRLAKAHPAEELLKSIFADDSASN